jgi:hypothetical protein
MLGDVIEAVMSRHALAFYPACLNWPIDYDVWLQRFLSSLRSYGKHDERSVTLAGLRLNIIKTNPTEIITGLIRNPCRRGEGEVPRMLLARHVRN